MKIEVTIPWEAVVEGCPPPQAKALPLVIARCCSARSDVRDLDDAPRAARLLNEIREAAATAPMALARSAGLADRFELILKGGLIAVLTSDRATTVVIQQVKRTARGHFLPAHNRDRLVRSYVARYAAFDADVPGFVANWPDHRPTWRFLSPERWGFTSTPRGTLSWTAHGMFQPVTFPRRTCTPDYAFRPRLADPLEQAPPDRRDPFQCLPELHQVQDLCRQAVDSRLPAPVRRTFCHDLALALGRCRLFGVTVPAGADFTLSPAAFAEASQFLLTDLIDASRRLAYADHWDHLLGALRVEDHALEMLEARMDAHAAYLALDEAYAAALYDASPEVPAMSRRFSQVRRLINLFDGNLQKSLPLLRLAASTYLLDNWRRLLAPAHRDCPPWWLDGCIG